jgi:hypothetical protein
VQQWNLRPKPPDMSLIAAVASGCAVVCLHVIRQMGFQPKSPPINPAKTLDRFFAKLAFNRMEAEGYRVCRAYYCHGAGPLVSAWNQLDGAPTPQASRLEGFRQLFTPHLLIDAIRRDTVVSSDVSKVLAALDAISLVDRCGSVFTMTKEARDEVLSISTAPPSRSQPGPDR